MTRDVYVGINRRTGAAFNCARARTIGVAGRFWPVGRNGAGLTARTDIQTIFDGIEVLEDRVPPALRA